MVRSFISSLFSFRSTEKLSISLCIGLAIGVLPLFGLRGVVMAAIILLLRLNVIAVVLGFGISLIAPVIFSLFVEIWKFISGSNIIYEISQITFANAFFSTDYYSRNETSMFIIVNIIVSLISVGVFISIIELVLNKLFRKEQKDFKYLLKLSVAASVGFFIGAFPVSIYTIIAFVVTALIIRSNFIASILGYLIGVIFNSMIIKYLIFIIGGCEDKHGVSKVLTGQLTFNDILNMGIIEQRLIFCAIVMLILFVIGSYNWSRFLFGFAYSGISHEKNYVFHDATGARWLMVKRMATVFMIIIAAVVILFGLGSRAYAESSSAIADFESKINGLSADKKSEISIVNPAYGSKTEVYAFYVSWDEKSKRSFEKNADKISVLITDWLYLDKKHSLKFKSDERIDSIAKKKGIDIIPSLSNYINEKWDSDYVNELLKNKSNQKKLIDEITNSIYKKGYSGLNLDFEYFDQSLSKEYTKFVARFKESFKKKGLKLVVDIQVNNNAFNSAEISKVADKVVMMLYDQHTETTKPGPVSALTWFKKNLKIKGVPKEKIVVGIGMYGYDWNIGAKNDGVSLTFNQLMKIADEKNAKFSWDSVSKSPVLQYKDGKAEHIIFFNDTSVFYNQLKIATEAGINSIGLWRLGSEDASMWDLLGSLGGKEIEISNFVRPKLVDEFIIDGDGEVVEEYFPAAQGVRIFKFDKNGWIEKENYKSFPVQSRIKSANKADSNSVALTFDDGPDPLYTPYILDILKKYNVKATFFVIGYNAEKYPELISRIYNEGHEIGNHTYSHIDTAMESTEKITKELNMTNRIIENATGRRTRLFRPPYDSGVDVSDEKALNTFININNLGYKMVGNYIDSLDWDASKSDVIIKNINNSLYDGNVILMHDSGGNRSTTIEVLPNVIESVRNEGKKFVTVGQLIGMEADSVMPGAGAFNLSIGKVSTFVNAFLRVFPEVLTKFFYVATTIGLVRFVFLIIFATRQRRGYLRKRFDPNNGFKPMVSIVVAAYNEEKVICKTVDSLLESDYENLEVIVVNDGSKDNTSTVVEETYRDCDKVRLINKANGGKSSAVNRGFMDAKGEIVVVLDADTVISKDAISLLVRHFVDKNVAAVSGNVKVGNVGNIWTTWQHVEYVTGLNLERRAFDALNCITVVPGAIGAWRKDLVAKAGYYKEDTLAEDADITLTFLRQGYKIVYEEGAKAFTEAPVDLKSLLKQRVRWSYGTLQCLWKHRDALFNKNQKTLGFIALPNTWLYQVVFQSLSPLTDILFFLGMIGGHRIETVITYILFFFIDLSITYYAFHLEGEKKRPLITLFIQRIVYRQLMTYVVYKSMLSAVMGVKVGWNKLKRLGNVVQ